MAQTSQVRGRATSIRTEDNVTYVRYHDTDVVAFDAKSISLNSDGYRTVTTKTRMNQASNQFCLRFGVVQRKGQWFVTLDGCDDLPYYDNMTFNIYTARVAA